MSPPQTPYRPYADKHVTLNGPGDQRPTCEQVLQDCNAIGKLKGKTVLITGCSSGIGVETARALYDAGATLFLTARDIAKLNGVIDDIVANAKHNKDGPKPQSVEIHLDNLASVRKGAEDFARRSNGKLNILIHNAGVMASPFMTTSDGFEQQIGVNHFAHFLLFQLLKPCLISSAKESGTTSRVINLSSLGHRRSGIVFTDQASLEAWNQGEGYEKWLAYGQSKTANILMANGISHRYHDQGLEGWSVHPGGILTELSRHLNEDDLARFSEETMRTLFKSADQGAATTVWAAVSDHFEGGKNGGRYLEDVGESPPGKAGQQMGEPGYQPHAYDEAAEKRLWDISCKVVGVKDDESSSAKV